MKRIYITSVLIGFVGLSGTALAEIPREIGQKELRRTIDAGQSLDLLRVMSIVGRATQGEAVDVRLFEMDGLFYRVVIVQPSGRLVSLVMDARTGDLLPSSSTTAAQVRAASTSGKSQATGTVTLGKANSSNGQGKAGSANGGNGGGNGNAGGGNSSGNGGGNGGGNSGGNGGGNGGSNGGGNGGGNSGGNGNGGGNGNR